MASFGYMLDMRKSLFSLIIGLFLGIAPFPGQTQQVVLNTRGERIVVYPDGSWRYYERADSTLMRKNLVNKNVIQQEESQEVTFEQQSPDPSVDADISAMASRFAALIESEMSQARGKLQSTLEDKFEAEARLDQAQENRKLIEPDIIAAYEDKFEELITAVKKDRKTVKWYEKCNAKTQDMLSLPVGKKPKVLNKLIADYEAHFARSSAPDEVEVPVAMAPEKIPRREKKDTPRTAKSPRVRKQEDTAVKPVQEITYQRAPAPCHIAQPDGIAASRTSISVEKGLLFTHTDEELRPYFRQQELVTCYAALMQIEDNLYLSLDFQIASSDARKNFGVLEKNSMLRVKLIDGTLVNLFNANTDQGRIDAYTGNTIFTGNYLIDREAEKALSRQELDKLRVVWSTGFEDYDVVYLDFLINQFSCLRSTLDNLLR